MQFAYCAKQRDTALECMHTSSRLSIGNWCASINCWSINKKTKAEKYCLNVKNDIEQIILDIDFAAKAGFERGHKLFDEYLSGYNIEALLSGELV